MEQLGPDFSIVKDISPENTAIISINLTTEYFNDIFSKLEFLSAFTYIQYLAEKHMIPVIHIRTASFEEDFKEYRQMKLKRRLSRKAPGSSLDRDFNSQFASIAYGIGEYITSDSEDIFNCSILLELLRKSRVKYALLTGFHTETAILRSSLSGIEHGIMAIVVSDAVSSYSERIYYEALDIISQSAEVIDSRDLMRRWPQE